MRKISLFDKILFLGLFLLLFSCSNEKIIPADPNEKWSFIVYGDLRQGYGVYSMLAKNIGELNPAPKVALCLGDIMLRPANEVEWLNFWRFSQPITDKMPLFIARGNHEGNDPADELILHQQGKIPGAHFYYTYHIFNCYYIILDTEIKGEEGGILNDQLKWLESQLDSISADTTYRYIFAFMHRPLYPQGFYKGDNLINADELHSLFLKHKKVKAVFVSHDHMYNKYIKDGIPYITTGGGGAPLYHGYGGDYNHFVKVTFYTNPLKINIKTIDIFNDIVENFDL
jgi:hypothetical protein